MICVHTTVKDCVTTPIVRATVAVVRTRLCRTRNLIHSSQMIISQNMHLSKTQISLPGCAGAKGQLHHMELTHGFQ